MPQFYNGVTRCVVPCLHRHVLARVMRVMLPILFVRVRPVTAFAKANKLFASLKNDVFKGILFCLLVG